MTHHEVSSAEFTNAVKPSVFVAAFAFARTRTGCVRLSKAPDEDDPRGEEKDHKYNWNNDVAKSSATKASVTECI